MRNVLDGFGKSLWTGVIFQTTPPYHYVFFVGYLRKIRIGTGVNFHTITYHNVLCWGELTGVLDQCTQGMGEHGGVVAAGFGRHATQRVVVEVQFNRVVGRQSFDTLSDFLK